MFIITRKLSDGRMKVYDSDDGGEFEYVSEECVHKVQRLGYKVLNCPNSAVDFEGGYAFVMTVRGLTCQVTVYDVQTGNRIESKNVNIVFYVGEHFSDISSFAICVYENEGRYDISLSLHDKHYYAEDRDETFYYYLEFSPSSGLVSKSKRWSK